LSRSLIDRTDGLREIEPECLEECRSPAWWNEHEVLAVVMHEGLLIQRVSGSGGIDVNAHLNRHIQQIKFRELAVFYIVTYQYRKVCVQRRLA
jgi:hypothetical protein